MPTQFSSFTAPLILAALGGLLLLVLRRFRGGLFVTPRTAGAHLAAMQVPNNTARPGPNISIDGRSSSGTPFPPSAQGEMLLVVDDEASVCELLSTVLTNHGYQVATARDGLEGAQYYAAHQDRVALVISDIHMPHSDGKSFADLLRGIRPTAKILLMSGMDNEQGTNPARSHDPFLLKPFKPAALLDAVHKILHPKAAAGA